MNGNPTHLTDTGRMVDSLFYQLACMDRRLWQNMRRSRPASRYSLGQRLILTYLLEEGEQSQCELGTALRLSGASVGEHLKKLERDGCIQRQVDPRDNRVKKLTLTPKGQEAAVESRQSMLQLEENMLQGFSKEEQADLLRLLVRMDRALENV